MKFYSLVALLNRYLWAVVLAAAWHATEVRAEALVINNTTEDLPLGPYLVFFENKSKELTVDALIQHPEQYSFVTHPKAAPNFGYVNHPVWAKLEIDSQRDPRRPMQLVFVSPMVDSIEIYQVSTKGLVRHAPVGDRHPIERNRFFYRYPNITLDLEPGKQVLYLRLSGVSALLFNPSLKSTEVFYRETVFELAFNGLYFGIMLAMTLYNLFLFLSIRDSIYLLYVGFIVFSTGTQLTMNGFHYLFALSHGPEFVNNWVGITIGFGLALGALFAIRYLNLAKNHPRITWLGYGLSTASIITGLASIFLPYQIAVKGTVPCTVSISLYCFGVGFVGLMDRSRPARFYVLAWTLLTLGTLIAGLRVGGQVPVNTFTLYAQQIGFSCEVILLALGLADRIKLLQQKIASNQKASLEEQKRVNEQLQRLDRLKDDFLANTSHELRTPLHAIIGLGDAILHQEKLSASSQNRLQMMLSSARRLASLVNDILDFSKLQHQSIELRQKPCDMHALAQLVIELLRPMIGQRAITLTSQTANIDLPLFLADENRLQQILINLVGNAIKFTHSGSVSISYFWDKSLFVFEIRDTGIGIPADKLETIFESFSQGDGSTSREFGGTGLGLAVTKKLVDLHQGSIEVESEFGQGSCFRVKLPLVAVEEKAQSTAQALMREQSNQVYISAEKLDETTTQTQEGSEQTARYRVLIADDDPVNLEVLQAQLLPEGYAVVTAADGLEALQKLKDDGPFDLALLDVMMPKMSGYELTKSIRLQSSAAELPIILLTAKSQTSDVVHGFDAGANDYLIKPFARQELIARMHSHTTIHLQNQAVKNLSEDLRHEMEAKILMVKDLAHRGNNPLQAGVLASEQIKLEARRLEDSICQLFGNESEQDDEGRTILNNFLKSFHEIDEEQADLHRGLLRAIEAIAEIRTLSGIDGRTLEYCDLQAILTKSLQRLEENLGSSASRLTVVAPQNPLPIFAQARVLLIVLESFWRDILQTYSEHLHLVLHKLESKTASDIYAFTGFPHEGKPHLHEAVLRFNYLLRPYEMALVWDAEQNWLLLKTPQNLKELQAA